MVDGDMYRRQSRLSHAEDAGNPASFHPLPFRDKISAKRLITTNSNVTLV